MHYTLPPEAQPPEAQPPCHAARAPGFPAEGTFFGVDVVMELRPDPGLACTL